MVRKSAIAVMLLVAGVVGSNEAAAYDMNVRVNPLGLAFGIIGAEVDFKVGESMTVGPSLGILSTSLGTTSLNAYQIGARANFYLSGPAISDGWFAAPYASFLPMTIKSGNASASWSSFSAGALFGYQWVWESGFNMDVGLGASYYSTASSVTADDGSSLSVPGFSGILPAFEWSVGYAF